MRSISNNLIFIVLDDVRYHSLLGVVLPDRPRIELVFLLKYSLDLNPVEDLWGFET